MTPLPKITISISEEDRVFLDEHPEIRPSGVFRAAMSNLKEKFKVDK